jgi:hypothetical protein
MYKLHVRERSVLRHNQDKVSRRYELNAMPSRFCSSFFSGYIIMLMFVFLVVVLAVFTYMYMYCPVLLRCFSVRLLPVILALF